MGLLYYEQSCAFYSHIYKEIDPILSGDCYLSEQIKDWRGYLKEREDEELINTI